MRPGKLNSRSSRGGKHDAGYSGRHVSRGSSAGSSRGASGGSHSRSAVRPGAERPKRAARPAAEQVVRPQQQRQQRRRRRRLGVKELLIILLPALAALVVVIVSLWVTEKGSNYQLRDSGAQYYGGSTVQLEREMNLKLEENGTVSFSGDNSYVNTETTLPIYMNNSSTIVLTSDMVYYMPRQGTYTRAASLSEISYNNGSVRVTRNDKSELTEAGFLYDGKDFYIFLEPVVVSFMGRTVELSALSYAEVLNGGTIMLFDYESRSFTMENLEGSATAQTPHGDYSISLLGDSMTDITGSLSLLMTKPAELDPVV